MDNEVEGYRVGAHNSVGDSPWSDEEPQVNICGEYDPCEHEGIECENDADMDPEDEDFCHCHCVHCAV